MKRVFLKHINKFGTEVARQEWNGYSKKKTHSVVVLDDKNWSSRFKITDLMIEKLKIPEKFADMPYVLTKLKNVSYIKYYPNTSLYNKMFKDTLDYNEKDNFIKVLL